jgi:rhodanese-related sulfurtransferase
MVQRVDALQTRDLLAEGARLVDVLPASVYAQEHLPGAISLPMDALDASAAATALGDDRDQPVVVVCFDQH